MSEYKRLTEDQIKLNSIRFGVLANFPTFCGIERAKEANEFLEEVFQRLAQYEDIGSPDEFAELAKAKAEGRLVVLSTPMIPLVQSDDLMDSDVYCPACGKTLSGGWPDYHPDQEWTMCQCFHCGQSIDDTKVVTKEEAEQALRNGGEER